MSGVLGGGARLHAQSGEDEHVTAVIACIAGEGGEGREEGDGAQGMKKSHLIERLSMCLIFDFHLGR